MALRRIVNVGCKYYNCPLSIFQIMPTSRQLYLNSDKHIISTKLLPFLQPNSLIRVSYFCSQKDDKSTGEVVKPSRTQMLKKAVAEYGTTVIVFHITISLISLGICYLVISSGVDVEQLLRTVGLERLENTKYVANTGTFLAAYAVHKVFAPVRITITLASAPLIVRYLRSIGFLKKT